MLPLFGIALDFVCSIRLIFIYGKIQHVQNIKSARAVYKRFRLIPKSFLTERSLVDFFQLSVLRRNNHVDVTAVLRDAAFL